jgi:hypothetical protein
MNALFEVHETAPRYVQARPMHFSDAKRELDKTAHAIAKIWRRGKPIPTTQYQID